MSFQQIGEQEIITLIAVLFLLIGVLTVFPAKWLSFDVYMAVLTAILAYYGIATIYKLKSRNIAIMDLIPGFEDRYLVGFVAIGSTYWFAVNGIMTQNQWLDLVITILTGLGLLYKVTKDRLAALTVGK